MGLFNKQKSFPKPAVTPIVPTLFPYFEINDLTQGTSEWLNWRRKVIGASDAPVIMGENRWQSRDYLMEEKLGNKSGFQGNAATREGHRLEGEARRILEQEYALQISPTIIQDGKLPYLAASLDGITSSHTQVFEIKCGEKSYEQALKQKIPDYYYGQLQHILMITQLDKIIYAAYRPRREIIILELNRDESYISSMRETEIQFAEILRARGHQLQKEFRGRSIER